MVIIRPRNPYPEADIKVTTAAELPITNLERCRHLIIPM